MQIIQLITLPKIMKAMCYKNNPFSSNMIAIIKIIESQKYNQNNRNEIIRIIVSGRKTNNSKIIA
jgi:hypothetical protein